jgi:O-antigen ligase
MANPIDPTVTSSADRGLLNVLSWMGMTYAVADGPRTREEFLTLLHRITIGAGLLALLGILQFLTKQAFTNYIEIPGLSTNTELSSVIDRNGFARPAGTAIHPIEFGAVLTMALPIALHLAMWDKERRALVRWFPVVAIAIAVPISISRSAILSGAIALIVVMSGWPKTTRRKAYLAIVGLVTFLFLTVHGLLGTISGLFTGLSSDSSASSRTGSYGLALDFIKRSPYFGRGFHTFSPNYHIFDNQYLGLLVELGVIGTGTVIVIFASAIRAAWIVRRRSTDPETRSLAQALAASVLSTGLSIALYDAFGFGMATGLMFVVIGCCGCLWRLYSPQSAQPDANAESPSRTTPADVRSQHAAQRARVLSRAARP